MKEFNDQLGSDDAEKQDSLDIQSELLSHGKEYLDELITIGTTKIPDFNDESVASKLFGDSNLNKEQIKAIKDCYEDYVFDNYINAVNGSVSPWAKRAREIMHGVYNATAVAENHFTVRQTDAEEEKLDEKEESETEPASPMEKVNSLLDKDIEELNNPEDPKWSKKAYNWLQKNSKLRMATGVITSVLGAYFGGNVGIYAAKGITGAISGGIGSSGLNSYLKERAAVKNYNKYSNESGELDLEKIGSILDATGLYGPVGTEEDDKELVKEELLDLYAEFTEISSAKGLKIMEAVDDKSERNKNVLQEKFPRLFDNKAVNWYRNKNWYTKALIGVGVGLGAGFLGGAAFGGALTAKVACSGIASLGMTAFQDTDDRSGQSERYGNSEKVIKLKDALEKIGLSEEDMQYVTKHREDIKKRSVAVGITGAAVMSIVLTGLSYNSSQHHGAEQPSGGVNNEAHKVASGVGEKPAVPEAPEHHGAINATQDNKVEMSHDIKPAGSENLTEELKGIHKIDAGAGASDRYAMKMVEGMEGKGQVTFHSPEDRLSMIKGMAHELREKGIFNAEDGHLEKIEEFKNVNPLELAHGAQESVNVGATFADINLNETGVSQIHDQIKHSVPIETGYASLESDKHVNNIIDQQPARSMSPLPHHNVDPAVHSGVNVEHAHAAVTPQQTEAASKEELLKATGAKVPPTWQAGHNFEAYNNGKPITESAVMDSLKDKQISKDSLNYINTLFRHKTLNAEDIHVSPDGKHLMLNVSGSVDKNMLWSTDIKNKSIFSGLFPGRTADIKDILPGQASIDNLSILKNQTPEASVHAPGALVPPGTKVIQAYDDPLYDTRSGVVGQSAGGAANTPDHLTPSVSHAAEPKAGPVITTQEIPVHTETILSAPALRGELHPEQNYIVNVPEKGPMSVSGEKISRLLEEAKKYFNTYGGEDLNRDVLKKWAAYLKFVAINAGKQ